LETSPPSPRSREERGNVSRHDGGIQPLSYGRGVAEGRGEVPASGRGEVVDFSSFDMAPTFGGRIKDVVQATRERRLSKQRVVLVSQQASRLAELYADQSVTIAPVDQIERPPEP